MSWREGQIVIPKKIRDALKIDNSSKLIMFTIDDIIIMKKLSPPDIFREMQEIFEKVDKNIEKFGELSDEEIVTRIKEIRKG